MYIKLYRPNPKQLNTIIRK